MSYVYLTLNFKGCYCTNITLALTIRWYLVRRNKARDAARAASGKEADDFGYVERVDENGQVYQQKVEKNLLDLTDKENQDFRYCL
jgi:ACS family allantoate permease-like MFS transporter